MPRKPHEPYSVGKGKPPKEHQFKKGQPSPNPRGRPRGSTRESQLQKMLKRKVWVANSDGLRVRKSLSEIIDHKLVQAGAGGDLKAIKLINELVLMHERYQRAREPSREELLQEAALEEEMSKAREQQHAMMMDYLELLEDLKRHGITRAGDDGFEPWVYVEPARRNPKAYWAKSILANEELVAKGSMRADGQPLEPPG